MTAPNVLWIYCDELRTDALGCYGGAPVPMRTPAIDSLAANGTLFENCFCNSPVCVPSRTSTLTARHPEQTGVYHNEGTWDGFKMPVRMTTFPEVFAACGYRTANIGKTHVPPQLRPWQHSDTRWSGRGDLDAVVPRDHPDQIRPRGIPTFLGGPFPEGVPYPHDGLVDHALDWIDAGTGPFFLRAGFLEPHTPVYPPPPFNRLYDPADFRDYQTSAEGCSVYERAFAEIVDAGNFTPEQIQRAQALYYGLTAWVDQQVGRLVAHLERKGLLDNTVILFSSDHGTNLGEGGRWAKHCFTPQSQRVPAVIQWPGGVPAGERRHQPVQNLDFARTLLGLCGLESPPEFLGRDWFTDPPAEEVFSTIGFGAANSRVFSNLNKGRLPDGRGWPRRTCLRTPRYRYERNVLIDGRPVAPEDRDEVLIDWRADPEELVNLAGDPAHAGPLAQLRERVNAHTADPVEPDLSFLNG